jgi:hypothetical protein
MVSNHLLLNKNLMKIQISILNFKFPIIDMCMFFLKYLGYSSSWVDTNMWKVLVTNPRHKSFVNIHLLASSCCQHPKFYVSIHYLFQPTYFMECHHKYMTLVERTLIYFPILYKYDMQ